MIVVFGSINIDIVTKTARIPGPGETVLGGDYDTAPGGKGANQALAARRAGAEVKMVGAFGRDGFAVSALKLLKADGVDLSCSRAVDSPTGAAFITVDAHGENAIVVASGANAHAKAAQLDALTMRPGDWLVLQREVPEAEVYAAAATARRQGAKTFLNNAPGAPIPPAILPFFDVICVNETEAAILGRALDYADLEPAAVMRRLSAEHGVAALATLGPDGAVLCHGGATLRASPPKVEVVDTTGAGDTFVGAFVAAATRGADYTQAMREGLAAGSLKCTKAGAQPAMPFADEIRKLAATLG